MRPLPAAGSCQDSRVGRPRPSAPGGFAAWPGTVSASASGHWACTVPCHFIACVTDRGAECSGTQISRCCPSGPPSPAPASPDPCQPPTCSLSLTGSALLACLGEGAPPSPSVRLLLGVLLLPGHTCGDTRVSGLALGPCQPLDALGHWPTLRPSPAEP